MEPADFYVQFERVFIFVTYSRFNVGVKKTDSLDPTQSDVKEIV